MKLRLIWSGIMTLLVIGALVWRVPMSDLVLYTETMGKICIFIFPCIEMMGNNNIFFVSYTLYMVLTKYLVVPCNDMIGLTTNFFVPWIDEFGTNECFGFSLHFYDENKWNLVVLCTDTIGTNDKYGCSLHRYVGK